MRALPVPNRLKPFVRSLRVYASHEASPDVFRRLPHAESELLISFGARATHASVLGARTRTFEKPVTERASTLLVRFRVGGAYPFFAVPMAALSDGMFHVDELASPQATLWGSEARAELAAASGEEQVARATSGLLERALEQAAAREPAGAAGVRRALRWLERTERLPRVTQLATELGVSERSLRRGFETVVGTSPKLYLRLLRFRRALSAARASQSPDWAALAEQAGYFDQAHLIADFRALTGTTPAAFLAAHATHGR
jgi:AraC-like DNA-binding protein